MFYCLGSLGRGLYIQIKPFDRGLCRLLNIKEATMNKDKEMILTKNSDGIEKRKE